MEANRLEALVLPHAPRAEAGDLWRDRIYGEDDVGIRRVDLLEALATGAARLPHSAIVPLAADIASPLRHGAAAPRTEKTPPERGFRLIGAPRFELGTSSPPD